jgi:hypothetical protein
MKKLVIGVACAYGLVFAQVTTDVNTTAASTRTQTVSSASVVTRGNVKIIEASEEIRFVSQELAKTYLYMYKAPRKDLIRDALKKMLLRLNESLRTIKSTTKDSDTKDILEFLAYSKDQIAQIIADDLNEENAALMLDYSETLLEGADSIAAAHAYAFSEEERMLIVSKKMEYLLERMMKYYFAIHLGFNNATNREQLVRAVEKFEELLEQLETYGYPQEMISVTSALKRAWRANMRFFSDEKLFIPKLMLLSTDRTESLIGQIALYHNKNL